MRKRLWLAGIMTAAVLLLASCAKVKYEAYVTIVNIGNMPMTAWVEGDGELIAAYDSLTWAISLESEDEEVQVHLEAEPLGGGDYDDTAVVLHGDRDIITWLTGWDQAQNANRTKKKSSLIRGQAPQQLLKR